MRPHDLPGAEHYPHGTRARYVSGCRCDGCRTAIRDNERERARRVREAAAEVEPNPGPPVFRVRAGRRLPVCPGTGGTPCVAGGAWLKPPWPGRVCRACVDRAAVWNGAVDAGPVRRHLLKLQRLGVGHKSVAAAADVGATMLSEILWDGKRTLRARAAARVLAVTVDAAADGARIDARPTWRLIDELLEAGLTKTAISRGIGHEQAVLCIGRDLVMPRTALRVRRLHSRVMAEAGGLRFPRDPNDPRFVAPAALAALLEQLRGLGVSRDQVRLHLGYQLQRPRCTPRTYRRLCALRDQVQHQAEVDAFAARVRAAEEKGASSAPRLCLECGASHAPLERQARLARLLPSSVEVLREALPCLYGTRDRLLYRDLRAVGAERSASGEWSRRAVA